MAATDQHAGMWEGSHVIKGERGYARTPMGQVHYSTMGDGPAVVMIHQTPWFGVQYAKVQPLLAAQGFRAIAPDTPGFGFSDVPDHPPTAEEYAANMAAFLDALGIKRAAMIGHHTGATFAAAFAEKYPERTRCVVLHGVPFYTEAERADRLANSLHPDTRLFRDGSHLTKRWQGLLDRFAVAAETESIQWSVMSFLLAGDLEWYGHQAAFTFDMPRAIAAIKAPALIVSNTGDSLHMAAERALKLRPDFAYHEIAGGNSHEFYDRPEPWAKSVGEFLTANCGG